MHTNAWISIKARYDVLAVVQHLHEKYGMLATIVMSVVCEVRILAVNEILAFVTVLLAMTLIVGSVLGLLIIVASMDEHDG
jgi:hypothetical protein